MVDSLLALCARSEGHSVQRQRLAIQAQHYEDWPTLPQRAEMMAMAPLVYAHLQAAAIALPDDLQRALAGLTLRHRQANIIRYTVLAEILSALKDDDIEVLVLKGAALALTVYPQPGLRPMRDMDILVRESDALRAQMILVELGFMASTPRSIEISDGHHLPVAQRVVDGLKVSVEVHHRLLPFTPHLFNYEWLSMSAISFSINEVAAQTPSHEIMLWHIYRHSFAYPSITQSIRLIWVADFVSLVEKHVEEIDWKLVKTKYPQVWQVLPVFHFLTPWSEEVVDRLQIVVDPPPKGIGISFQGWPKSSVVEQKQKGIRRFLRDTFWPTEWWTWLYYGVNHRTIKWWWIRMVRHPLHIAGWVLQYLRKQL